MEGSDRGCRSLAWSTGARDDGRRHREIPVLDPARRRRCGARPPMRPTSTSPAPRRGVDAARRRLGQPVHAPALAEASEVDKSFLLAMSTDDGPSRMADVQARLGETRTTRAVPAALTRAQAHTAGRPRSSRLRAALPARLATRARGLGRHRTTTARSLADAPAAESRPVPAGSTRPRSRRRRRQSCPPGRPRRRGSPSRCRNRRGALPTAVGSMRSTGIFDGLASLGLHI